MRRTLPSWPLTLLLITLTSGAMTACSGPDEPINEPSDPSAPDAGQQRPDADMSAVDMPTAPIDQDISEPDQPITAPDDMSNDLSTEPDASEADAAPDMTEPDPVRPPGLKVVSVTPGSGTLSREATFTLRFDRPLDRSITRASLIGGECVGPVQLERTSAQTCLGASSRYIDDTTLEVTPRHVLDPGAALALKLIPQEIAAADGTTLAEPWSAAFTVQDHSEPAYSRAVDLDAPFDFTTNEQIASSQGKGLYVSWDSDNLTIGIDGEDLTRTNMAVYVAIGARRDAVSPGVPHLPSERWFEGATTFLPFHASHLFMVKSVNGAAEPYSRTWRDTAWGARQDASDAVTARLDATQSRFAIKRSAMGDARHLDLAIYLKDLSSDGGAGLPQGWGWTFGTSDPGFEQGYGDRILSTSLRLDLQAPDSPAQAALTRRFGKDTTRARVYQLLMRTFSNTNETRKPNGTLVENGVGTFDDLTTTAAQALADMGMTHIWLTGVVQQATSTDWSSIGQPPDDPDILKGLAGSPYAVRDYFDVSPDYARDPAKRQEAFRDAIARMHQAGLKVVIDFVPNHVARSYDTDIYPELNFGLGDDHSAFYTRDNHFFYLQEGQPPVLMPGHDRAGQALSPTCQVLLQGDPSYRCDGYFDWRGGGEMSFGRVTGNNVTSWSPSLDTWYETVKVNYGLDFTTGRRDHPVHGQPELPIPRSWHVMDAVIAHWQSLGVDGFRADMVHMVPMEFHGWLIARSRARDPQVIWLAEAYDNDPAKVISGNVLHHLLGSGYDAVYDDPTYDQLKSVFDGSAWLNDLDGVLGDPILRHHSLRYAENHDEVRLASRHDWRFNGENVGLTVGPAVTALLHGIGRGPTMLFAGQETGEPAAGVEGFGGDDGRTTIFDYWSMPTFTGWVNNLMYDGGGLDAATRALRDRYMALHRALSHRTLEEGELWLLNGANTGHAPFGRAAGEGTSGHYSYAFLRYVDGEATLIYAWLHPAQSADNVSVLIPAAAWQAAGLGDEASAVDRLGASLPASSVSADAAASGLGLGTLAPGEVRVVTLTRKN